MELLFWIDALKRASAASVTAVIPYFSYAKGDKKDEPRVSIRARVCADAIEAAGVDRVITLDLHAPQVQGFFKVPVDDLYALPVLCDVIATKALPDLVVVAPDAGFAKKARQWSERLGAPLAIADKRRVDHSETAEVTELIGSVEGLHGADRRRLHYLGGNVGRCGPGPRSNGAPRSVYAAVTHGLLAGPAIDRIDGSPIGRLFMTDSVETQPVELSTEGGGRVGRRPAGRGHPSDRQPGERLGALHLTAVPPATRLPARHPAAGPRGRGVGVHDAEMTDRPGQRDIEQAEAAVGRIRRWPRVRPRRRRRTPALSPPAPPPA